MLCIDSHVHLDDKAFDSDREDVLARAQQQGVSHYIIPAVCTRLWQGLYTISQDYKGCYPAYGLHPYFLSEHTPQHLDDLSTWLDTHPAVAVGECGLDYFLSDLDPIQQRYYFEAQINIACEKNLPLIIHARHAVEDVLNHIRQHPQSRGVIHSFSGSEQQARRLIDLGFYLSFGGVITYERTRKLRRLVQVLPLDALLVETDAPDQPVASHRQQRNEPAYLSEVVATIAQLRGQSQEEVAAITTHNTQQLFNLPL